LIECKPYLKEGVVGDKPNFGAIISLLGFVCVAGFWLYSSRGIVGGLYKYITGQQVEIVKNNVIVTSKKASSESGNTIVRVIDYQATDQARISEITRTPVQQVLTSTPTRTLTKEVNIYESTPTRVFVQPTTTQVRFPINTSGAPRGQGPGIITVQPTNEPVATSTNEPTRTPYPTDTRTPEPSKTSTSTAVYTPTPKAHSWLPYVLRITLPIIYKFSSDLSVYVPYPEPGVPAALRREEQAAAYPGP